MSLTESLLRGALFFAIGYAITSWAARQARLAERKRNAPFRQFAAPVFEALNDPDVDHVEITIKSSEDGHNWDGHRAIHYKAETRP